MVGFEGGGGDYQCVQFCPQGAPPAGQHPPERGVRQPGGVHQHHLKLLLPDGKIGGGKLAGQILTCMETAINNSAKVYSRYGSNVHKQVYIYGGLDVRPIELTRSFGMMWGVGGWLLTPFLQKIGAADGARLRARVVAELKTTFASHYTKVVSLQEALQPPILAAYNKRATGEKYLINPHKG